MVQDLQLKFLLLGSVWGSHFMDYNQLMDGKNFAEFLLDSLAVWPGTIHASWMGDRGTIQKMADLYRKNTVGNGTCGRTTQFEHIL